MTVVNQNLASTFKAAALLALGLPLVSVGSVQAASDHKSVYVGAGIFCQNMLKTTTSTLGKANIFGTVYAPELSLSTRLSLGSSYLFPTIGYTVIAKTESDGVKKRLLTMTLPYAFPLESALDFKLGPGWMIYSISGDGSAVTLLNGVSSSTFYEPGSTQASSVFYLDFGFGSSFNDRIRFDLDAIVPGLLSSRRSLNVAARLSLGLF